MHKVDSMNSNYWVSYCTYFSQRCRKDADLLGNGKF